jgi:hypothetical protein
VNIEHEDTSLGRIEGLEVAAGVLLDAARRAGILRLGQATRSPARSRRHGMCGEDRRRCRVVCRNEVRRAAHRVTACAEVVLTLGPRLDVQEHWQPVPQTNECD